MKNDLAMAKIKGNETDSGEDYEEKELAATSLGSIKRIYYWQLLREVEAF